MKNIILKFRDKLTVINSDGDKATLKALFGLPAIGDIPATRDADFFELICNNNRISARHFESQIVSYSNYKLRFEWNTSDLKISSIWRYFEDDGIIRRQDTINNKSNKPVNISRYLYRYAFVPGDYDFYYQSSQWCNENQGSWNKIKAGEFQIGSYGGRFTRQASPFVCLRHHFLRTAVAFNLICDGDWIIKIKREPFGSPPSELSSFITLELGSSDDNLSLNIEPDEQIVFPEIIIQTVPDGDLDISSKHLQLHLLKNDISAARQEFPVIYNTWFDCFDQLDPKRLSEQVKAAKQIGCDAFVVDSGWYGQSSGSWSEQVGDWREKLESAFRGQMKNFAEMVRSKGLKFGLWIEPERFSANVPSRYEHPEWYLEGEDGCYYPDLLNSSCYEHVYGACARLVETYQLAWMKIDNNFGFDDDPRHGAFKWYYEKFFRMLEDLRRKYPQTIFEGCSSGGMRLDLNCQKHFDAFLGSDDVNPYDLLANLQHAGYRLLPSRLSTWSVMRSGGRSLIPYGTKPDAAPESILTPAGSGAVWEHAEKVSVDFSCAVAMLGVMGFSGDIASLSPENLCRIAQYVKFYKEWQQFLMTSYSRWLTAPRLKGNREDWAAVWKGGASAERGLLFCFRLNTSMNVKRFYINDLSRTCEFIVRKFDGSPVCTSSGIDLAEKGLQVNVETPYSAVILYFEKVR